MTDQLLTTAQVADRLGVSTGRVRQLSIAGGIGTKYGRARLFTPDDLQQLATRNTQVGRPPVNLRDAVIRDYTRTYQAFYAARCPIPVTPEQIAAAADVAIEVQRQTGMPLLSFSDVVKQVAAHETIWGPGQEFELRSVEWLANYYGEHPALPENTEPGHLPHRYKRWFDLGDYVVEAVWGNIEGRSPNAYCHVYRRAGMVRLEHPNDGPLALVEPTIDWFAAHPPRRSTPDEIREAVLDAARAFIERCEA